ncbi:amino acid adenylation domain-containing protein [Streptomyces pactum]|uniref:Amino acid adenylation domain-containing protein n=1 Tax=Streptomyces pactum TaxID=68249 RepID=A0ABS0NU22_9ACTN|nr:non-ribosomal peptide synthetase [Streptomyces pactum]MBH5338539.1 amino acid adenylation domain-containing protein [Streptomyces pactum]
MVKSRIEDVLPLSPLQEGLYFHAQYDRGEHDVYTVQFAFHLEGELDAERLRTAVDALLRRHPNLRAGFRQRKTGEPVQIVRRGLPVPWYRFDLSGLDPAEREAELARLTDEDRTRRFDLSAPPLLRFTLVSLDATTHRLLLCGHHILLDGWSVPVLLRELLALHRSGGDASALPRATPYKDYLAWLGRQDRAAAERAWTEALAGLQEPTLVAGTAPGRAPATPERLDTDLSEEFTRALQDRARARGVTLNTVVQCVWGLLLSRLTGRDDVVFGATVSGRPPELPGVESMVGLFINTLPVRVRLDPAETVDALLGRVQAEQTALIPAHHVGLSTIQRAAGLGELFDTLTVFENYPLDQAGLARPVGEFRLTGADSRDATHYPLSLVAMPGPRLHLRLEYRPDLFDRDTAERLLDRVRVLLRAVVREPALPVGRLEVRTAPERYAALRLGHGPVAGTPAATFPELFAAQVRRTPDATALVCGDVRLGYAELDRRANRLAHHLTALGVAAERIVALAMRRTEDLVVAILAVLKAGGAYLPVDLDHPADRIAYLLEDARPVLVLTDSATTGLLPAAEETGPARLVLDEPATAAAVAARPDTDPRPSLTAENAAYVIYTSGSTGRPKGVVIQHRSLANLVHDHLEELLAPAARAAGTDRLAVGLTASLSFDTSWDELLCLAGGHELHLVDDDTRRDPEALVAYVAEHRVQLLDVTPTYAQQLLAAGLLAPDGPRPPVLMIGGEAAGEALWHDIRAAAGTTGHNYYGPTECTVDTLVCRLDDSDRPLVGRPISNTRAYVLDPALRPVLDGVAGELYLAGEQLARGYLDRPGLTAERFVADPFGPPGTRMYRTGDVMRWTADGRLEFIGRSDDQVKIRGFRIELGEIETALLGHPAVAQAAVIVPEDRPGTKRLVAYVAPKPGAGSGEDDPQALRRFLADRLPDYMVPAAVVVVDALPMNVSGKLDRAALPAPDFAAVSSGRPPRTPREEILCELFAEVLDLPAVGTDDNFFALGGHSLLATRLASRVRTVFGTPVAVRTLFEAPTVAGLAERLDTGATGGAFDPLLTLRGHGSRPPLFCVHPAGGLSWPYAGLLRHLGPEYPVYGLQARGLDRPEEPPGSVAEMAADYIARLRTVQPIGPYHLVGWSLGGSVAHAMATELQRQGEEVALLALLDCYPEPAPAAHAPADEDRARREEREEQQVLGALLDLAGCDRSGLGDGPLDIARVAARVRSTGGILAGLEEERLAALCRVALHNERISRTFVPATFRGDVLFFRATVRTEDGAAATASPDAWSPHLTGSMVVHDIPCRHDDMMRPEPIARIGRVLGETLKELKA